ncbi:MAG: metallophosphoesterase [Myxococcota bacterium]|jgi:hypothetical protein|nr:metallophosphoesterase [Myxococcota bacterium]
MQTGSSSFIVFAFAALLSVGVAQGCTEIVPRDSGELDRTDEASELDDDVELSDGLCTDCDVNEDGLVDPDADAVEADTEPELPDQSDDGDDTLDQSDQEEVPTCSDDCPRGLSECFGAGWRLCGDYDEDDCAEWSPVEACGDGLVCDTETASCREACGDYCEPFSVILLPDTQYYTSKQANNTNNTYRKQMNWIVDHRASNNIQFVIHLGDITDHNDTDEWQIANDAHAILDAADMPYSMLPGNHDYKTSDGFQRGDTQFDDWFGSARFAGKSWYGGKMGSSAVNNYTFFEIGPMKFIVISLEYAPRKDALCWAEELIASHPEHQVIIATHCYLSHNGRYAGCPNDEYNTLGADGATTWKELVSRYANVFMIVSGHVGESHHNEVVGNNGNVVHEIIVDYQFEDPCTASTLAACTLNCQQGNHTGNGWMRELVFDPRSNTIHAKTFTVEDGNTAVFPGGTPALFCSPLFSSSGDKGGNWYSTQASASDHDFSFDHPMTAPPTFSFDDAGKRAFLDRTINRAAAGNQYRPRVAVAADDHFVAVWQDNSSDADGAGNYDIMARGFEGGGCAGFADFTVNDNTAGQQRKPDLGMDDVGNFVVVWEDDGDANGSYQIHARGFNADGSQRLARFTVNSISAGQQFEPAIAMNASGRFVIAWADDPENDGSFQVLVRGFNADGSQAFADRSVHDNVTGDRRAPAVAMDDAGNFVVAWADDSDGNGIYQIHARGFTAAGGDGFARITVNGVAAGQQRKPAIGMDASGRFVVAWEDEPASDGVVNILGRGFNADGTERLADFAISGTGGEHLEPRIAMASNGDFVSTWADDGDGNGSFQIRMRGLRTDGAVWLAAQTVNSDASGQQEAPSIAVNDGGTVVVLWEDDMDGNGSTQILGRGYDAP